ncbi:hypothetical protein U1Q18_052281, partial [Sarracenia purpurea var. burkii]
SPRLTAARPSSTLASPTRTGPSASAPVARPPSSPSTPTRKNLKRSISEAGAGTTSPHKKVALQPPPQSPRTLPKGPSVEDNVVNVAAFPCCLDCGKKAIYLPLKQFATFWSKIEKGEAIPISANEEGWKEAEASMASTALSRKEEEIRRVPTDPAQRTKKVSEQVLEEIGGTTSGRTCRRRSNL